jgi:hypothetical protein
MEETNFERTENDYCTKHREKLVDYCFDDHEALCHVCSHYEDHKNHKVKPLKEIMVEEESTIIDTRARLTEAIKSIELSFFKMNIETLQAHKELYISKLKSEFAVLYKMLDKKFSELYSKIVRAFEDCLSESEHMKVGFSAYLARLHYIRSVNCQRDIDLLHINMLADDLLGLNISTRFLHDFDIATESIFINEPVVKVQKTLDDYDFIDISERSLKILRQCFLESVILKPELVMPEFQAMFPSGASGGIQQSELLYKMQRDGCTPEVFHKRCNNKGATIMFIHANKGYVFGAFNPTSWLNEFSYSETDEAFLFSLCEPYRKRKPFKCRVKPGK